jgi:hypothetical protein
MKTLLIAALACATPALADAPYASCLRQGDITQFEPARDNRSLIVTDAFRKKYRLNFTNTCYGLTLRTGITFHAPGTGGMACLGKGDQVLPRDSASPPRCYIGSIEHYTPEMEAADKAAYMQPLATRP